ncbi:MAG: glycosyltransferase [Flavobacteriales bacterium]|nr:glycosyltransferase [Flavobacteriales bacterium]
MGKNQTITIIRQTPKFIFRAYLERKKVEKIISENRVDVVISDNRFGFRGTTTLNIIITHQLNIQGPFILKGLANSINKYFIKKFDFCWVPDFSNSDFSGKLSESTIPNSKIGPLSRFYEFKKIKKNHNYKYLAIISGPEPQRSLFEKEITSCFTKEDQPCAIISGKVAVKEKNINNISIFPHLKTREFQELINNSKLIISRSGYSSLMDYYYLQKKINLVPTPGQTEQEYLALYHRKNNNLKFQRQGQINLQESDFKPIKIEKKELPNELLFTAFEKVGL